MSASKAQRAATAKRRSQAIGLKLAGLDYETIADRLEYKGGRGAVCKDIERALVTSRSEVARQADELREIELQRIDRLQVAVWSKALAGDRQMVETTLKLIDRRCKLLGLDAPVRAEVWSLDAIDAQIQAITDQLDGLPAAGEVAGATETQD